VLLLPDANGTTLRPRDRAARAGAGVAQIPPRPDGMVPEIDRSHNKNHAKASFTHTTRRPPRGAGDDIGRHCSKFDSRRKVAPTGPAPGPAACPRRGIGTKLSQLRLPGMEPDASGARGPTRSPGLDPSGGDR